MRKQTLLFVLVLALTLLVGCWNKPFDLEAWNSSTDDYERCAMGASLTKILPGMSQAEYYEMFYRHLVDFQTPENAGSSFDFLSVGMCMPGCHGGGLMIIRVDFEDGIIVKAARERL